MNEANSVEPDDRETTVVRVRADHQGTAPATAGSVVAEGDTTVVRSPRSGMVASDDTDRAAAQQRTAPGEAPVSEASPPQLYGPRAEALRGAVPAGEFRSGSQPVEAAPLDRPADQAQSPAATREQLPSFARRTRKTRVATLAGYMIVVCVSIAGLWAVGVLAFTG